MHRITKADLQLRIDTLNDLTSSPMEAYAKDESGEYIRTPKGLVARGGHYHLNWAYSGVGVDQMCDGGGSDDIIPRGTKRETYDRLGALIQGIRLGQKAAPPVHVVAAAPLDRNGNPRRVSVKVCPTMGVIGTADHGYRGAPKDYGREALRLHVSATEYKELVAMDATD
jgi:hypothetical protein